MMSMKQWFVGMVCYMLYLLFGAVLYYISEHQLEKDARLTHRRERIEIYKLLHEHYAAHDDNADIMRRLEQYCGRPVTNTTLEDDDADGPYKWNYFNSFLFTITVTTTVGYGNLSPTSDAGRMWMILYALIGIPFTGILLATLGEFFSIVILRIQDRYKRRRIPTRLAFIGDVAIYICMGILVFILLPACVFVYIEQWSWGLAIYYAFVTVSTIGFGDYVAAQQPELGYGEVTFTLYRIALIFWLIFGLGYYFMVLAYLTRAWRSKRMLKLEHKLAKNFKETQAKVWQGVKDIGYLRRILNEVYLQRVKPVYRDDDEASDAYFSTKRSSSLPDLASFIEQSGVWRRRANSVASPLRHSNSETDIEKIDRAATFKTAPTIQAVDLLQHVVDALGSNPYLDRSGVEGFAEKEILGSEGWSVMDDRPRAATDVRIPMDDMDVATELPDAQWTWSGAPASRHIHDLMRARQKRRNTSWFPESDASKPAPSKTQGLLERWHACKQRHKAKSLGSLLSSSSSVRRGSLPPQGPPPVYTQLNYHTHTIGAVLQDEPTDVDSLLEETSIGELLRALTTLHSRVPPPKPPSLENLFAQPPPTSRRFSMRRVSSPITHRSLITTSTQDPPTTERRRFSIRPSPPPSYVTAPGMSPFLGGRRFSLRGSPSVQGGPRRSSLRPAGSSPSSSGRQFQPLRPRFMIGPYERQNVARSRHDTS